jgi:hypothetical protein
MRTTEDRDAVAALYLEVFGSPAHIEPRPEFRVVDHGVWVWAL